ncbi:hypothetical protein DV736_g5980, partial [Chaetothyriales sp. CBS 134916]
MKTPLVALALAIFCNLTSAGPIVRGNTLQERWVVTATSIHRRQADTSVSSINPFAVPTSRGTEDGGVPAVGIGGTINTSLLPSATNSSIIVSAAAEVSSRVIAAENSDFEIATATNSDAATAAATTTIFPIPGSDRV